ncbi:glucosamine-6-phosphate deaminase [Paenibacillus lignilyticus]|uniref:Glucosamine-6-phosphate deaminase n=1 Tax=Paenibacillus lignilyticus TaxID=1172615 RepID=A0ABS5CDG8_9BACL|nr:glucosamine-6-phosphate deaminase [Paenibacillus lignilyticus]MBP3964004.1 glucosamine-6-phosphate deaminase [Paenibacillus lignilyticus]
MNIKVMEHAQQLGEEAAEHAARILQEVIERQGRARLLLSTGSSQFEFLQAFVKQPVEWSKVEMFHLDEYAGIDAAHAASFQAYLKERFISHVNLAAYHLVDGRGDVHQTIARLNEAILRAPIDLAMIGIGENAHIAFNDPPADFETEEPYLVVELDDACKRQQVGEGWFASLADVPAQAITMSVRQIMKSKVILSCVPHAVKADAIKRTLESDITPLVPATMLRSHPNWTLYLDQQSAAQAVRSDSAVNE